MSSARLPPFRFAFGLVVALTLALPLAHAAVTPAVTAEEERAARYFGDALESLEHEFNEYARDGKVSDQDSFHRDVLAGALPRVHETWKPVRDAIAARDPTDATHMDADLARLDEDVRAVAPNDQIELTVDDLKGDVNRVLGLAAVPPGSNAVAALQATEARVNEAVTAALGGHRDQALQLLASAYLDVYAPGAEAAVPRDLNARIEQLMNVDLRSQIQQGASAAEIQTTQAALHAAFAEASQVLATPSGGAGLFANAFVIIAREGFEAALVLAAVVAYLVRSGHAEKTRQVYVGAGLALLMSLALFALVNTVIASSGVPKELMEGATALLAVVVLFYVSYWLIDKVEIKRWNRFIQGKVRSALVGDKAYALVAVAFLAVFREGLETVLFMQALLGSAQGAGSGLAVLGGFAAGFVALAVVFFGFTRYGVKIPMRPFFIVTSAMLYYLAFAFAGVGVHELQDAGVVGATPVPGLAAVLGGPFVRDLAGFLGLFPTVETLAAQALLIVAAAGGLAYSFVLQPRREAAKGAAGQTSQVD